MNINIIFRKVFVCSLILISHISMAGNGTSPNPVGGFGSTTTTTTTTTTTSSNPVGGFGTATGGGDAVPLSPPPPPGDPVPLDGGASLMIAAALGLGIKKIYGEMKNK